MNAARVLSAGLSLLTLTVGLAACSALLGIGDVSPWDGTPDGGSAMEASPDALPDSGATDATGDTAVGASDGGDAGVVNLVPNPSFDQGAGGCGPGWTGYNQTLAFSTVERSGSRSCEVCPIAGSTSFELSVVTPVAVAAGSYYAEAWLEAPAGMPAATQAGVQISYANDGGANTFFQGSMILPSGTWAVSQEAFVLDAGQSLTMRVHVYGTNNGACILVDDVALYAQ
jgi:hypothetical protein